MRSRTAACWLPLLLPLLPAALALMWEGDILISEESGLGSSGALGARLADPDRLWRNGIVYYQIHETITAEQRKMIEDMMEYIQQRVGGDCIQFRPGGPDDGDYVRITANGGGACTGRRPQVLNLDPQACMTNATVVHELLHTLGQYCGSVYPFSIVCKHVFEDLFTNTPAQTETLISRSNSRILNKERSITLSSEVAETQNGLRKETSILTKHLLVNYFKK